MYGLDSTGQSIINLERTLFGHGPNATEQCRRFPVVRFKNAAIIQYMTRGVMNAIIYCDYRHNARRQSWGLLIETINR